jgi:muramoyltetrapeptide carboxypeptidase LdcA involved in peptidoglycan recycling
MKHLRIVCTAKKINPKEIAAAESYFLSKGFEVSKGQNLHSEWNQFAGTDAQRAADLTAALQDETVDVIWFARGGYGSLRVWQLMEKTLLANHNKTLLGYSDMTVWLNQSFIANTKALHATMPISFADSTPESLDMATDFLLDNKLPNWEWKAKESMGDIDVTAKLFGGNLSLLYSLTGTPLMEVNEPIILMIEDLDEYYYSCDRMLINLVHQPFWKNVKAVVLGGFTSMNDNDTPFGMSIAEILHNLSPATPVVSSAPYGHQNHNLPWIVGASAQIRVVGNEARLNFLQTNLNKMGTQKDVDLPVINYEFWLDQWDKQIGAEKVYSNKNTKQFIVFDGNTSECANKIVELTKEQNLNKEIMLRVVDLIYSWGGPSGRMFYSSVGNNLSPRKELEINGACFATYEKGVKLARAGDAKCKEIFKTIKGIGSSFASKHAYFWSLSSQYPLIIVDSKIAGVLGYQTVEELERKVNYLEIVVKFKEKASVEFGDNDSSKVERALFAFHNYYFLNDNSKWKNKIEFYDYPEAERLAKVLFD